MIDFSKLNSKDVYLDYTVKNYMKCYDKMEMDSIQKFTTLFENLKNHKIEEGNLYIDSQILHGIKLTEHEEKKEIVQPYDLQMQIDSIINNQEQLNAKESVFLGSLTRLINVIGKLDSDELLELNDLFEQVGSYNQDIDTPVSDNKVIFYSYIRNNKK